MHKQCRKMAKRILNTQSNQYAFSPRVVGVHLREEKEDEEGLKSRSQYIVR